MTTSRTSDPTTRVDPTRAGRWIGEALGPIPLGIALCVGVGAAANGLAGAGWGLLAIVFAAVLPYLATWRVRHPADGARPSNATRVRYLAITLCSAAFGTVIIALEPTTISTSLPRAATDR